MLIFPCFGVCSMQFLMIFPNASLHHPKSPKSEIPSAPCIPKHIPFSSICRTKGWTASTSISSRSNSFSSSSSAPASSLDRVSMEPTRCWRWPTCPSIRMMSCFVSSSHAFFFSSDRVSPMDAAGVFNWWDRSAMLSARFSFALCACSRSSRRSTTAL